MGSQIDSCVVVGVVFYLSRFLNFLKGRLLDLLGWTWEGKGRKGGKKEGRRKGGRKRGREGRERDGRQDENTHTMSYSLF